MKVACIGNMNNMIFPIARYIRDAGHEVTLFLLDEYDEYHPSTDSNVVDIDLVSLGWNESSFKDVSKKEIKKLFGSYNYFIGTDYSAAYLSKAGIKMDFYLPAGSDIYLYPFKTNFSFPPRLWEMDIVRCALHQFWGIKNTRYISLDLTNKHVEDCILKIGPKGKRVQALPYLYLKDNQYEVIDLQNKFQIFEDKIKSYDFVVMQHGRQSWQHDISNMHNKRNDKLIRSFAKLSKAHPNCLLALFVYGEHVAESKALIDQLGIAENVLWIPKMQQKELMQILNLADINVGQLGHSWLSYGSVYEALACGVAFMGFRKDSFYIDNVPSLYPMINVETEEDIFSALEYYRTHKDDLKEMGAQGKTWLIENAIVPIVDRVVNDIKNRPKTTKMRRYWKLVLLEPYFFVVKNGWKFYFLLRRLR